MRPIDADRLVELIESHRTHVHLPEDSEEARRINEFYSLAHDHIIQIVNMMPSLYGHEGGYYL